MEIKRTFEITADERKEMDEINASLRASSRVIDSATDRLEEVEMQAAQWWRSIAAKYEVDLDTLSGSLSLDKPKVDLFDKKEFQISLMQERFSRRLK